MPKPKKRIIDLLIENEKDIAKLYRIYSKIFLEFEGFWQNIVQEEDRHVQMLTDIKKALKKDEEAFYDNNYSLDIINYIARFMEKELQKAKDKKINPRGSFECALRIEQSIIESRCFDIFVPTKREFLGILKKINQEAKNHARLINKELERHIEKTT
jgi:hypothetical protein